MKSRSLALGALFASVIFLSAYALTPILERHTSLIAEPFEEKPVSLTASTQRQNTTASFSLAFTETIVDLTYVTPVPVGSSTTVRARLSQRLATRPHPSYGNLSQLDTENPYKSWALETLRWPVTVKLKSAAFKFDDQESERKLPEGTQLPVELIWSPVAQSEGESTLVLGFGNLTGIESGRKTSEFLWAPSTVSIDLNGKKSSIGANDEFALPISIQTKGGIPAWLWERVNIAASLIAFVLGSSLLMGWLQKAWTWLRRRTSPTAS